MHILVVDDDPLAGALTLAILESAGHSGRLVEHGIEALERLSSDEHFDLVVSDLHMPLINGLDLLAEMRGRGLYQPFVLLTGDDPGPLLASEPRLLACLTKDETLEQSLPQLLVQG